MPDQTETIPEVTKPAAPRGRPRKNVEPDTDEQAEPMVVTRLEDGRFRIFVPKGKVRRQIEGFGQRENWQFLYDVSENGVNTNIRSGLYTKLRVVEVRKSTEPDGTEVTKIKPLGVVEL